MDLMISLGIILGLMAHTCALPIQNSSVIQETKRRLKREYSEALKGSGEMNAMDRILRTNGRQGSPRVRGLSFREGDIASSYNVHRRSAITCPGNSCLWPKSVDGFVYVPYIISPQYGKYLYIFGNSWEFNIIFFDLTDDMDRITIEMGMLDILLKTCVKFVPRSHETNYLDIQPRFGCWSFLGMTEGPQPLSLQSPGCMWSGIVSHELMHALGFVHEQSRSDRDRHVSIIWENIMKGQKHNFKKYQTNNLNTVYDYGSIMHYGRYAFSEDGGPTIIPKPDPNTPIGQRDGPSVLDIQKINRLYECGGLV
ncbi:hatching enzyme 1.2 [Salmo salar]|uniref:Metalloendopeptidase n=1 Tax=Salmo salar TaxID=8030 RepID=A0ABM3DNH4_SALSA|nr:hatching enzyme 1.2 [Salmo salar]